MDRTARSIDLNSKEELDTFANQLYSGDSNSDKREAFIKSINSKKKASNDYWSKEADKALEVNPLISN